MIQNMHSQSDRNICLGANLGICICTNCGTLETPQFSQICGDSERHLNAHGQVSLVGILSTKMASAVVL